jgi:plastocyanin
MRNTHLLLVLLLVPQASFAVRLQSETPNSTKVVHMTAAKQFSPMTLTLAVGDTVEWVNDDPQNLHNATTDKNASDIPKAIQMPKGAKPFNSGLLAPGKHYTYRFTVPGTYRYVCAPHQPEMVGTIVVQEKRASSD